MANCYLCDEVLKDGQGVWYSINKISGDVIYKSRTGENAAVNPPRESGQFLNALLCSKCIPKFQESLMKGSLPGPGSAKSGGCYIATATFGDINHPTVMIYRDFRDRILMKNSFGQLIVSLYYRISPSITMLINRIEFLKKCSSFLLGKISIVINRRNL